MTTDQSDTDRGEPPVDGGPALSWSRIALTVGIIVAVAAVAVPIITGLLTPVEPYGTGTVTIAGQTHDAAVCESLEHGIELHYGDQDHVLYVRHMGPPEVYEDLEVQPARMDGTYFARAGDTGEQWSQRATLQEHTSDGVTYRARFDDGAPVTVTYDANAGGWCAGADPNVLGR